MDVVCVLIFVNHYIFPAVLVIFESLRRAFEKPHSLTEEVVKIECSRFAQLLLIGGIYLCGDFQTVIAGALGIVQNILRAFKAFLGVADSSRKGLRGVLLFIHAESFKAFFDDP